ncbi:AAA family ATPase, partial [Fusobacterium simiae]|uniref:AAA family ATPase n=1 Tax=Fusobacterium simiae TaxID=855 RepID=UPI0023502A23
MIKRNLYLEEIKKYMNKPIIKVITGMHRSGKSMILKLIQEELKKDKINEDNIIYINFESLIFMDIKDYETLYKY